MRTAAIGRAARRRFLNSQASFVNCNPRRTRANLHAARSCVDSSRAFHLGVQSPGRSRSRPVLALDQLDPQMAQLEELIDDLIYGGRAGDVDEIRESLAAGAPVDGRDANGTTALMMAAANGHVEAMQVLLSAGADINATNERGNTSLHWAVFTGQEEAVKTLLAAGGCDVFLKNEQGLTAAMDAERAGKGELVVLILNWLDDEDAAATALGIDEEKEAEGYEAPVERLAPQARAARPDPEPSP